MKDRDSSTWVPHKDLLEKFQQYSISKSPPDKDDGTGIVQTAIRINQEQEDIMRIDSYKEGYLSVYWDSDVTLAEFLSHSEDYFRGQEAMMTSDKKPCLGIFTANVDPQVFEFDRPLNVSDFEQADAFMGDKENPLLVIRLETPAGSLVWEVERKTVGIIVDNHIATSSIDFIGKLINQTQPLLTTGLVSRALSLSFNPKR